MQFFRCHVCDEREIPYDDFFAGTQLCNNCKEIRDLNPKIFDYFINILDKKIEKGLDSHWDSYHNDKNY